MNYLEIFDDVVSIVHNDYSGCVDKKGWDNPDLFRQKLIELQSQDKLTPKIFQGIIEDYLLDFKDGHLIFRLNTNTQTVHNNGFKCRRHLDKLYVTYAGKEVRLWPGIAITALEGRTIPEIAEKHKRELQLYGDTDEREEWSSVISKYKMCTVLDHDGKYFEMNLEQYAPDPYNPEYSFQKLDNNMLLMKLSDFENDAAIAKLLEDNEFLLNTTSHLIIDVRSNRGGSDTAYFKLLNYIFPSEISLDDIDDSVTQSYMSERNYNLRASELREYLKFIEDPETLHAINVFLRELDKYKDVKGLVEFDLHDMLPDMTFKGQKMPAHIVVLSDVDCGSSGDSFVAKAGKSSKVTIMGRGTAGITDYSNLATQCYDDVYIFMYATSRDSKIDKGLGLTGKGVQPDIYIPWTPEHIERDVDFEKAIEYLRNK